MSFVKFMAHPIGRWIRVIAGVAIAAVGIYLAAGAWTVVLIAVGAVVFLAGALNLCIFAPLFGGPFSGRQALQS
jgi:TRAP-type C4-dicarboxylate transport system permease small subunit